MSRLASGKFVLAGRNSEIGSPNNELLRWPLLGGTTDSVQSDLGWFLEGIGLVPKASVDLVRIASAAYLADRLTARGTYFTRELSISVEVSDYDRWSPELIESVVNLLHWLTGDLWSVDVIASTDKRDNESVVDDKDIRNSCLLSGGLDSYLGSLTLLDKIEPNVGFLGHSDSSTAVKSAQRIVGTWIQKSYIPAPSYSRIRLNQVQPKAERSSRSRSFLFLSMGLASALGSHGDTLYVPENGYTSLNIPLHINRSGALSTRSTHPETFAKFNSIASELGLKASAINPFEWMTKGEMMKSVAGRALPEGWKQIAAKTISCSKLDGARVLGGSSVLNCGLCVSCLVRRGAFIAGDVDDETQYLVDSLTSSSRAALINRRRSDIEAVRYALEVGVDEDALDAGTWPPGYDLDRASDLVRRGLDEIGAVSLL